VAKEKQLRDAEAFVRKVLAESFNQKADAETVRSVGLKVSRVVAENAPKTTFCVRQKSALGTPT
jgi:hypothetical protein